MPDALTPAQLDRIEDALEALEADGVDAVMAAGDADVQVEQTLRAYRSILELSREALEPVDVPHGLLDDVLAEARAVAAKAEPETRAAAAPVPWYRRIRWNIWGPGLAFAGSAALLLLVARPAGEDVAEPGAGAVARSTPSPAATPAADADVSDEASAADRRLADATLLEREEAEQQQEAGRGAGVQGGLVAGEDTDKNLALLADEPAEDELAKTEVAATRDEEKSRRRAAGPTVPSGGGGGAGYDDLGGTPGAAPATRATKSSGSSSSGGKKGSAKPAPQPMPKSAPPPPAEPEPAPQKKKDAADDSWSSVLAGDSLRRAGKCGSATTKYQSALDGDAKTEARALAGLGLCALQRGDDKAAAAYFAKARKADPSVKSFIDAERALLEPADPPNADVAQEQPLE